MPSFELACLSAQSVVHHGKPLTALHGGLAASNAALCVDIRLIRPNGISHHGRPSVGEHGIQDKFHLLGRLDVLLPLVVDNALCCVDDLRPGKPGLVHGLPQVRGRLYALVDLVPLHGALIAAAHGKLQRQVRICDQSLRRLLVIAVQLRVVKLESVHVSAAHAVRCPAVNVLRRVHLVHLSACVHADVAAIRKRGELLIGQFRLVNTLSAGKQFQKRVHFHACISAGRCYTGCILLRG